jgi:hypothetical protein
MTTLPYDEISAIARAAPAPSDLPAAEYPPLVRIVTTDPVAPTASNKQQKSNEKRTDTLLDRVNKLIENSNALPAILAGMGGSAAGKVSKSGDTMDSGANLNFAGGGGPRHIPDAIANDDPVPLGQMNTALSGKASTGAVSTAQGTADAAYSLAATANGAAGTAQTTANNAQSTANSAATAAANAVVKIASLNLTAATTPGANAWTAITFSSNTDPDGILGAQVGPNVTIPAGKYIITATLNMAVDPDDGAQMRVRINGDTPTAGPGFAGSNHGGGGVNFNILSTERIVSSGDAFTLSMETWMGPSSGAGNGPRGAVVTIKKFA